MSEDDHDSDPQMPTPVEHSRFRRVRLWAMNWWKILTSVGLFIIAIAYTGTQLSWYPVFFAVLSMGWFLVLAWWFIKVYYHRILAFDYDPDVDEITISRHLVPLDISHEIEISGPRGMVRDPQGETYDIVKEFDPETLIGIGTWSRDWTAAHAMAYMGFAYKIVHIARTAINEYSMGTARAEADFLRDRAIAAAYRDFQFHEGEGIVSEEQMNKALKLQAERYDERLRDWEDERGQSD